MIVRYAATVPNDVVGAIHQRCLAGRPGLVGDYATPAVEFVNLSRNGQFTLSIQICKPDRNVTHVTESRCPSAGK